MLMTPCQAGHTTLSSFDEVHTPRSSHSGQWPKPTEGPRGPHLFRSSTDPSHYHQYEEDYVLSLSPMTPKPRVTLEPAIRPPMPRRRNSPFEYTDEELDLSTLPSWTPEMVAQSMLNAGIELRIADRFIENDITGAILMTLRYEDLRELDIQSFGIRRGVWTQIQVLKGEPSQPPSPRASTPIEDTPSREVRREMRKNEAAAPARQTSSARRGGRKATDDHIMPSESVSIIGIEQVIPKVHNCSKGENCSKWRRQQKALDDFKKANPHVDINAGGTVMVYGDVGNPETARALDPNEPPRPFSDAVTSVVASSDVLGPGGLTPFHYLQEATLRNMESRDAQDNVRQFLNFQQHNVNEQVPPTPPFEITAPAQNHAHHGLRRLPKLSIPSHPKQNRTAPSRASVSTQGSGHISGRSSQEFVPYQMEKADPRSPDLETPRNPYRFGTPFSEMDVPVTAVPLGPVARDASQSVPPDMSYRAHNASAGYTQPRSQSRASARRPSFPILPAVNESQPFRRQSKTPSPQDISPKQFPQAHVQMKAPPRGVYPWTDLDSNHVEQVSPPNGSPGKTNGVSFQGPMKKRKTRLLRHEWQDGFFTVKGTRLNMHKDQETIDKTLEYIDIDDYAIACSSLASTSKLSAAFKAVNIKHSREKSDPVAAFSFQLIPQDKTAAKLRKRDSAMQAPQGIGADGVNGTGKTHHFAVKSRDDRIDWMRELMLAKAMKQKGDGFEISVNGNMI